MPRSADREGTALSRALDVDGNRPVERETELDRHRSSTVSLFVLFGVVLVGDDDRIAEIHLWRRAGSAEAPDGSPAAPSPSAGASSWSQAPKAW